MQVIRSFIFLNFFLLARKVSAQISGTPDPFAGKIPAGAPRDFNALVRVFINLLEQAIPIFFALALLIFFWGVARFIWNAGNESIRLSGRKFMVYGIITLFVMITIWGILQALDCTFLKNCGLVSSAPGKGCTWQWVETFDGNEVGYVWQCI